MIDGTVESTKGRLVQDKMQNWTWRTQDGQIIPIHEIADSHLRNIALFLMGMGYTKCVASDSSRIKWLTVMRMEWERRQHSKSLKRWLVK